MRRKVFDVLVSAGGLLVVAMLLAARALLMWGYSFASSSVHSQLAKQGIFFPATAASRSLRPMSLSHAVR